MLDLIREGKVSRNEFSMKGNERILVRFLAKGKPREIIGLCARDCDISRSHYWNLMKFGGILEDTPVKLWTKNRSILMARLRDN